MTIQIRHKNGNINFKAAFNLVKQRQLQSARLYLRRPQLEDWPTIQILRSDPNVNRYVQRPPVPTKIEATNFIEKIIEGIEKNTSCYWSIFLTEEEIMIGTICLWQFSEDGRKAEIGYDLLPDYQRKGLMSEAIDSVLYYAKNHLKLTKIEAYTHRANEPSIRLLKNYGFKINLEKKDWDNKNNIVFELDFKA